MGSGPGRRRLRAFASSMLAALVVIAAVDSVASAAGTAGAAGSGVVGPRGSSSNAATVDSVTTGSSPGATTALLPGSFTSLPPTSVLDTRVDVGAQGPISAGAYASFAVAGVAGVPRTGASAVVLSVAVTNSAAAGAVVFSADDPNAADPVTTLTPAELGPNPARVSGLVIVAIGADGLVDVHNGSPAATHVYADVTGYFAGGSMASSAAAGATDLPNGGFAPVARDTVLDTAIDGSGPITSATPRAIQLAGVDGIPAGGAVSIELTALNPSAAGDLSGYASGAHPSGSAVHFDAGQSASNSALVPLGPDGRIVIATDSTAPVDVAVVVTGYTSAGTATAAGSVVAVPAARALTSAVAPLGATSAHVLGVGALPSTDVAAVLADVTVTAGVSGGYLSLYAGAGSPPETASVQYSPGVTTQSLVMVPVSADGELSVLNGSADTATITIDVVGYVLSRSAPRRSTSHYLRALQGTAADAPAMNRLGCSDATSDAGIGGPAGDSIVLLDVGAQTVRAPLSATTPGVLLSGTATRLTYAQLVAAIDAYLDGYSSCQPATATAVIALGTNNDGDFSSYPAPQRGADWATQVVGPARAHGSSRLEVVGAADIEAGFSSSEAQAEQWVTSYLASTPARLVENGSADGCPTSTAANCDTVLDDNQASKTWTQQNYYDLAHGLAPTRIIALPQIYLPVQAGQWAAIDQAGATASDHIDFAGVLTSQAACLSPTSGCVSMDPATAFDVFASALRAEPYSSTAGLTYATDLAADA